MSIDTIRIDVEWDDTQKMYVAEIAGQKFTSRYSLWAKAHALQWYANELYRIKVLTTPLD